MGIRRSKRASKKVSCSSAHKNLAVAQKEKPKRESTAAEPSSWVEEVFPDGVPTVEQVCARHDVDGQCPYCKKRFYWSQAKHLKNGKHFCPKCGKEIEISPVGLREDGTMESSEWVKPSKKKGKK
jgi:hypothetical protein